mgnify:CR=1 FL=1
MLKIEEGGICFCGAVFGGLVGGWEGLFGESGKNCALLTFRFSIICAIVQCGWQ